MEKGPTNRKGGAEKVREKQKKNLEADAAKCFKLAKKDTDVSAGSVAKEEERVWMQADYSKEQGLEEEAAAQDQRNDNLAGDTACSDSVNRTSRANRDTLAQRGFLIQSLP